MKGRTVVITGATTGIGKETARALVKMGADVILLARSEEKARATTREFEQTVPGARVEYVLSELASLASVRAAAEEIRKKCEKIHVLVNNAGLMNETRLLSRDGHELTFAVNHLAHFLLTSLLRDRLIAAALPTQRARIVNVSSMIHAKGRIDWDDVMSEKRYEMFTAYAASKLANVMFTCDLARELEGSHVTANCLHPGVIGSGFGHNNRGWLKLGVTLVKPLLTTPEKGAHTSIKLASSPELEGVTGQYFDSFGRIAKSSPASRDEAAQRRLRALSEALCERALQETAMPFGDLSPDEMPVPRG